MELLKLALLAKFPLNYPVFLFYFFKFFFTKPNKRPTLQFIVTGLGWFAVLMWRGEFMPEVNIYF